MDSPADPRKDEVLKDLVDNYHLDAKFAERAVDRFFADLSPEAQEARDSLDGSDLTDELYERTEYFDEQVNGFDPLAGLEGNSSEDGPA